MGTAVRVELWGEDPDQAEAAMAAVMAEMHRIDRTYSPHRPDSELSVINRDAADRPVPVSAETLKLLQRAQDFAALSGGAFDITYASVGHLYDYREGISPTDEVLDRARAAVGYRHLLIDPAASTVRFAIKGMRIDLGGFAKGHAVDNATAIVREHGIAHAMVSAGGDSRVIGDRRGRPWTIGIRDPRRAGEVVAVLPLEDVAISTSGDYERYFERRRRALPPRHRPGSTGKSRRRGAQRDHPGRRRPHHRRPLEERLRAGRRARSAAHRIDDRRRRRRGRFARRIALFFRAAARQPFRGAVTPRSLPRAFSSPSSNRQASPRETFMDHSFQPASAKATALSAVTSSGRTVAAPRAATALTALALASLLLAACGSG